MNCKVYPCILGSPLWRLQGRVHQGAGAVHQPAHGPNPVHVSSRGVSDRGTPWDGTPWVAPRDPWGVPWPARGCQGAGTRSPRGVEVLHQVTRHRGGGSDRRSEGSHRGDDGRRVTPLTVTPDGCALVGLSSGALQRFCPTSGLKQSDTPLPAPVKSSHRGWFLRVGGPCGRDPDSCQRPHGA